MKDIYVRQFIEKLGLSKNETAILFHLINQGPRTATQLTNESKLSRYAISQCLDNLTSLGLVDKEDEKKSTLYIVKSVSALKEILKNKKKGLQKRSEQIDKTIKLLKGSFKRVEKNSKIAHYSGISGLKQIMWNSREAEKEIRLFEVETMSPLLDFSFYDSVREEYVKRNISYRELTNEKNVKGWTSVKEFLKIWDIRYIDSNVINMSVELMLYNDVYCLYGTSVRGVWGVEIYNIKLAEMQKKVFDFMWDHGQKMKVLDDKGACKV